MSVWEGNPGGLGFCHLGFRVQGLGLRSRVEGFGINSAIAGLRMFVGNKRIVMFLFYIFLFLPISGNMLTWDLYFRSGGR